MTVNILPLSSSWAVLLNLSLLSYSPPRPSVVSGRPLCVCAPPKHTPRGQLAEAECAVFYDFFS